MIIEINRLKDINETGVYKIINIVNNKFYIGSTSESFIKRWSHHINALRRNTHKNIHLQNAFNKYGEKSFKFEIIETCSKDLCLIREQVYLNTCTKDNSYNINPIASALSNIEETINKQIESKKAFYKECLAWYKKYKDNTISFEEIPNKFKIRIKSYIEIKPWNKGKHYNSTEHLKVRHKKSDRSKCKNTMRDKNPIVYVYDSNMNFIDNFRSSKDLEELSITLKLPIKSRFSVKRMGKPICFLSSGNINKAIKNKTQYKGLYFFNKPLHPGMDDKNEPKSVEVWNDHTEVN